MRVHPLTHRRRILELLLTLPSSNRRFSIGRETARLFHAAGSEILALNRTGSSSQETGYILPNTGDAQGSIPSKYYSTADRGSILAFFSDADVVINTLPDSEHTKKFVGVEELTAMKGDAVYVNIGRGTTTDQDALVEALKAKKGDGEDDDATGTLRIGGASLEYVYVFARPPVLPSVS